MHDQPIEIRYSTGEVAQVDDRIDCDGWQSIVEKVISTREQANSCGLDEPGLRFWCKEVGFVFQACNPIAPEEIVFEGRAE